MSGWLTYCYRNGGKRLLDVVVSALLLLILLPLFCLVWLLVRLLVGSPAIFAHFRPGKNDVPFLLYKFRTMITLDRDEQGKPLPDEQRVTRFGKLLRSTSLDELPELWNVLWGDMSLVGPRPLLMEYLERYSPEERRRHHVRPGLTGWAQVNGRNAISFTERFKFDVWYVDNCSLAIDFKILGKTFGQVLLRKGIEQAGGKNEVLRRFDERLQR